MGEDGGLPTGGEVGNKGYIGAGGEQTAQIITLSSGMEREKQGVRVTERLTVKKKESEDVVRVKKTTKKTKKQTEA